MRRKHDENQIALGVAYIHGRVEAQLERFADAMGISTLELTERLVEALRPAAADNLPGVRQTAGPKRDALAAVEVAESAHGHGARGEGKRAGHVAKARAVKARAGQQRYWDKFTPAERKKEWARRLRKRTATIKARQEAA